MDPQTALLRFLYLGNNQPVHICSDREPSLAHVYSQLTCIQDMMSDNNATLLFDIIQRTMTGGGFAVRRIESIIALAYCVRCVNNAALRVLVYSQLAKLLVTDTDLFRFVHWASQLKLDAHAANSTAFRRNGFGRGMRRAVAAWYRQRTPLELVDCIGRHRGQFRWTHCDLLAMCHVKFEPTDERLMVINALHQRGVRILLRLRESFNFSIERTAAVLRLEQYLLLKVCERTDVAIRIFCDNGFQYDNVPSHLRASGEFWLGVGFERLPYSDLLSVFLTLNDHDALKPEEPLCIAMMQRLANAEAVVASDVQPLKLLSIRNGYAKGVRPAENVKAQWYREKHSIMPASPLVLKCLQVAVNNAFANVPDMGSTELYVTLDLHDGASRCRVFNMEHLNCYEAMVLLALVLVKGGRTTLFAEQNGSLQRLNLSASDEFNSVMKLWKKLTVCVECNVLHFFIPILLIVICYF